MGKTTNRAVANLGNVPSTFGTMTGSLVVKDPVRLRQGLPCHEAVAQYDAKHRLHLERVLMAQLLGLYHRFDAIPSGTTLVFAANWSPCTQCTSVDIPDFLKHVKPKERGIRVKFRFKNYATRKNWEAHGFSFREDGGGACYWDTAEKAQRAYDALMREQGTDLHDGPMNLNTGLRETKEKRCLVIEPIEGHSGTTLLDRW